MSVSDDFEALDAAVIERFANEGKEENLHLEFKTLNDPSMSREDRRNYAKALSGFANSDGGIVVWGVDCRRSAEGVDVAQGVVGITDVPRLLSKLNEYSGQLVSPTVEGVVHKQLGNTVATLIPQSDATPHMAKGGEDRYYKRNGDQFLRMESFEVEDMFGRRPHAKLKVFLLRTGEDEAIIGLENTGRGSARAPYLAFNVRHPWVKTKYGLDGNGGEGLERQIVGPQSEYKHAHHGVGVVIHPGIRLSVTSMGLPNSYATRPPPNLEVRCLVSCEGMVVPTIQQLGLPGRWP